MLVDPSSLSLAELTERPLPAFAGKTEPPDIPEKSAESMKPPAANAGAETEKDAAAEAARTRVNSLFI
jgi:hypothetical protein